MTELPESSLTGAPKRLALVALLAGILVALLGILAPPASASPILHTRTRVAAMAEPNGQFVGSHATVAAVQGRERAPDYDRYATGSSVAAEDVAGVDPSTPTGQRGSPMDVPRGTNSPAVIDGTPFSGHALDEMQSDGIPPSVVSNTIDNGVPAASRDGATVFYDQENNVSVVRASNGNVVTVSYGDLRP
jgi:hypothetical protein